MAYQMGTSKLPAKIMKQFTGLCEKLTCIQVSALQRSALYALLELANSAPESLGLARHYVLCVLGFRTQKDVSPGNQ